jgi:hypothetical protein
VICPRAVILSNPEFFRCVGRIEYSTNLKISQCLNKFWLV